MLSLATLLQAQKKKEVLFTVDKSPVYTDEFIRVFEKNRSIVTEENQRSLGAYLELYINYKLKLKEAYKLGLDTVATYKRELQKYREQLIQPYLSDKSVSDSLVQQAYQRMLTEINASHILVRLDPKASPEDSLRAYQKIMAARKKVVSGVAFDQVAKEYSEDPSAQKNGGNLGYFTAFGMVYPFENAAYTSEVNEVSKPFKTSFGYHIVRVNDRRPSRGEIEVAHIMIKNNQTDSTFAINQINELYKKLKQGDSFDFLAQQYSDDKSSAPKGGRLPKFAANKMIASFSDVAFSLTEENEISNPFQTPYGWHIIRLIKRFPVESFEDLKPKLQRRIENSPRARFAGESVAKKLKNSYTISENSDLKNAFLANDIKELESKKEQIILNVNKRAIDLKTLLEFSSKQRGNSNAQIYDNFVNSELLRFYKDHLEETNQEFALTMQEYKDGLLLFDLLQQKVWKRAEKDTVGLREFFKERRSDYMHEQRGDLIIASCTQFEKAKKVKQLLEQNRTVDQIKSIINENATIHVLFSQGLLGATSIRLPKEYTLALGVSEIYNDQKGNYVIIKVNKLLEPSEKKLNETRGLVINDYQEYIEKEWVSDLKEQHDVKINKRTLKRLEQAYLKE